MTPPRIVALTVAGLLAFLLPADAQDHLIPEASIFSGESPRDYYRLAIHVFTDVYALDVDVRAIILPQDEFEYAVGVGAGEDGYEILHLRSPFSLLYYDTVRVMKDSLGQDEIAQLEAALLEAGIPTDWRTIAPEVCRLSISPVLGKRLEAVWYAVLQGTRYPTTKSRASRRPPTEFHFSVGRRFGMAGYTSSPSGPNKPTRLVRIAEQMRTACLTREPEQLAELDSRVSALEKLIEAAD